MIFHTTGSLAGVPHPPPLLTIDGLWRDAVFVDGSNLKAQRSNTQLPVNKLHIHYIYIIKEPYIFVLKQALNLSLNPCCCSICIGKKFF